MIKEEAMSVGRDISCYELGYKFFEGVSVSFELTDCQATHVMRMRPQGTQAP